MIQAGGRARCDEAAIAERLGRIGQLTSQHAISMLCRQMEAPRGFFHA